MEKENKNQVGNWTEEEVTYLKKWYGKKSTAELEKALGRTATSIISKASRMKLNSTSWTEKEEAYLKKWYGKKSNADIAKVLGRASTSIKAKAARMKLNTPLMSWTEEEVDYLKKWFGHKSNAEIAQALGRTAMGIRAKATKLNLKNPKTWTEEEVAYLKEWYGNKSNADIAKVLGRTETSIQSKAGAMKLHTSKLWTEEEVEYLEKWYGKRTLAKIAKALGRTEVAVQGKVKDLQLQSSYEYNGEITENSLSKVLGVDHRTIANWRTKKGLPFVKRVTLSKRAYNLIPIDKFWKWAEENQSLINFSKIEKNALPPEPEWVEEARKRDYHSVPRNYRREWTIEDENRLWNLFYFEGKEHKEIAEIMNRTQRAIKQRLYLITESRMKAITKRHKNRSASSL